MQTPNPPKSQRNKQDRNFNQGGRRKFVQVALEGTLGSAALAARPLAAAPMLHGSDIPGNAGGITGPDQSREARSSVPHRKAFAAGLPMS